MTQLTENVYAVEVPEGASNFKIEPHLVRNAIVERDEIKLVWESSQITHNWVILPAGSWQLLCTTREASEEQAKGVVLRMDMGFKDVFANYAEGGSFDYDTGVESLNSLITSKGLDGNKNYVLLKKG